MGLRRVLFLTEVLFVSVKSQDSLSGLEVAGFEAKSHGTLPAVSRHAGFWSDPACGYLAVASRYAAPLELVPLQVLIPHCGWRSAPVANLVIFTSESPPP
jgi:hypothetical protein